VPFLDVQDTRIHFQVEGPEEGDTVVLVNSLATNLSIWDKVAAIVAKSVRVLRYDARGQGASGVPEGPYSIEGFATDLIAMLDSLNLEKVHICGLSLGAMVGMWIWLGRLRIVVDDHRVTEHTLFGTRTVAWDDVQYYTFSSRIQANYLDPGHGLDALVGIFFVAVPNLVIALIWLLRRRASARAPNRCFVDGQLVLHIDGQPKLVIDASYRNCVPALDRAFAELHRRVAPQFAPFDLVDGYLVFIDEDGARARIDDWVALQAVKVPWCDIRNVVLLFEHLAERGMKLDIDRDLFLPQSTLDKLGMSRTLGR